MPWCKEEEKACSSNSTQFPANTETLPSKMAAPISQYGFKVKFGVFKFIRIGPKYVGRSLDTFHLCPSRRFLMREEVPELLLHTHTCCYKSSTAIASSVL
uniref:Uncharacterized protein n=1 Tax=Cacopsylla melanoneura TaxID=428564 RepID=A0A8D8SF49_9HEMI